jgi:Ser/Thr protein kinase RdoA (MazF antagonist)
VTPTLTQDEFYQLARAVLIEIGKPDASLTWLAYTHNAVFAVEHESKRYVLRIKLAASPEDIDYQKSESWLLGRYKYQGIDVPHAPITHSQYLENESPHFVAILFEYLEGTERTPATLTVEDMRHIGDFLARLHDASSVFTPPPPIHFTFIRPRLDYEGLYGDKGTYAMSDEAALLFSIDQPAIMTRVQAKVKTAMDTLGTDAAHFGLIHGDLLLKNILFHGDEVRALDFEYCGWGYFLYDLAPLLWQLKPEANYQMWENALWEGYTALRPLPPRHLLETFIAGRQVASLRWVANNQHNPAYQGKVPTIIQQRISELEQFLETGVLRRG